MPFTKAGKKQEGVGFCKEISSSVYCQLISMITFSYLLISLKFGLGELWPAAYQFTFWDHLPIHFPRHYNCVASAGGFGFTVDSIALTVKRHLFIPSFMDPFNKHAQLPSWCQATNQSFALLVFKQLDEFYFSGKVAWNISLLLLLFFLKSLETW